MRTTHRPWVVGLMGAVLLLAALPARAQVRIVPGRPDTVGSAESQDGVFLPLDRTQSRGIHRAQERIAEGEYTQAIRFLDEVLEPEKEDSFVAAGEEGEFAGLKATARRILSELPDDGRQLYEATYGPVARRELHQAIDAGDHDATRRVSHRYFHTDAGYEATLLLAQHESDMGRHLSAALAYDELLNSPQAAQRFEPQLSLLAAQAWLAAGNYERAEALISRLRQRGQRSASVAGQPVRIENAGDHPVEWLVRTVGAPSASQTVLEEQWLTHRGNASRNGHVEGGLPHMRVRWAVRLLSHPDLEEVYDNLTSESLRQSRALPVAATPLAVGDYVVTCSAHNLLAVDFRTGKRVWQAQPQLIGQFEQLISASTGAIDDQANVEPTRAFGERVWRDHLYSSISSDGERIYAIRDLTLPTSMQIDPFGIPGMGMDDSRGLASRSNRLCAYDLATQGKLVWEIDGAAQRDELAGAFFLGAPLAIGESLYALAEIKSAIYLVALDRETGQFEWQQQLLSLEADIFIDTLRRLQAISPSYDAGILVCPTGAEVVVGVDLAKHALSWAYRYDSDRTAMNVLRMRQEMDLGVGGSRWLDNATIIADGRVLVSPPESNSLHCLDLVTGKTLWKLPREEYQFVAGVDGRRVLLVGNKSLACVDLETKKPVWQRAKFDLPAGSQPSGRGFFSRGRYFLPLSNAMVLAVDVETGVEVDRAVARDGEVLGNLICHRGSVLSQSGRFLDCFDQIEVLRQESEKNLATNPNDYAALRTLGEIAYNEGRLAEAIDYLERALGGEAESLRAKEVLVECLEMALDEDFATYQDKVPLLAELAESSGHGRTNLLRLQAEGLLEIGDSFKSFRACLELFESTPNPLELLRIGGDHEAQVSRWVRAQLASIWNQADSEARQQISRQLTALIDRAAKADDEPALRRFLDAFQSLDPMKPLMLRAAIGLETANPLGAQQVYMYLAEAGDQSLRGEAIARCSRMLHERDQPRQSLMFDLRLRGELADVACFDGKTGRECLAEWASAEPLGGLDWPYGEVEVASIPTAGRAPTRQARSPLTRVRLERTDDMLGLGGVFMSVRRSEVIARDGVGRDIFVAPLEDADRLQIHDPTNYYGVSRGSLLVVSQGGQLVALNTLANSESGESPVLWRSRVVGGLVDRYGIGGMMNTRDPRRPAPSQAPRPQQEDRWIGVIGPVTHDSCIYQDQRRLVCVDSLTGEVRWWRSDVPPGCDLYGDEELVFAVPRDSQEALVFSAIDGRPLGQSSVPSWNEQLATRGRQVVRWHKQINGKFELSAVDALTGEVAWRHEFAHRSEVDIAQGRYVAVVEPIGRCAIVDSASGVLLVDHQSEERLSVNQVYLLAGSDAFVLAVQLPVTGPVERRVQWINQWDYAVLDGQVFVFDRHTGQPAWSRSAEVRQESFILSQPVDLPVVAFAGNVVRRNAAGGRQNISLLLLEKSSGRLLFRDDTLPQSGASHCELQLVDDLSHEMEVEMASQTVRLKFTDRQRPPEPPAVVGGESATDRGPAGLLGIGRKLLGGD